MNVAYPFIVEEVLQHDYVRFMVTTGQRKIPCWMDGFLESHRKIVHTVHRHLAPGKGMKTAQLANLAANKTNYHHDEANMAKSCVGLAADFVGSSNLPLLKGEGQFGAREYDGRNFASPRYTHIRRSLEAGVLFKRWFDLVLARRNVEGEEVLLIQLVAQLV